MKTFFISGLLTSILFLSIHCTSTSFNIHSRAEWNAGKPKAYKSQVPVRITIHHEGEIFNPEKESSEQHIKNIQTWGMGEARNWSDIPYHFLIDLDGNIFEGRNVFTAGETATEYDPEGHLLITCLGNFEEQKVTDKQLNALIDLTAYCCKKYQIDPSTIKAHRDFAKTLCPGKDLYRYLESGYLENEVKKRIK
ncbi:MAG: peptidoglycan recognition protein family protein [Ignavibacteriaceae bacterium]|jgi:flavodoxin|nr:peptidoglycan recognition protein family protein [Ignavibacteriaceae bacterium]